MSIAVLNEVLDSSRSKSTARTLLIVMADAAHEDGLCWPGIERLAKRVNTSERNIQLLTRELEEMGELHVEYAKGRGNTNLYRVLPPLTLERLTTELTARLEKVKDSAEKVKSRALLDDLEKVKSRAEKVKGSAPLRESEKVKSGAEKVKDSAEKVKSRAEKVKPISPEPTTTIKNQLQPNDVVRSAADSDLPDHPQAVVAGQGVSEGSGFADSSRSQVGEIFPATGSDTQQEEIPGAGAARAALTSAFSPWDATGLIGKFASRQFQCPINGLFRCDYGTDVFQQRQNAFQCPINGLFRCDLRSSHSLTVPVMFQCPINGLFRCDRPSPYSASRWMNVSVPYQRAFSL